MRSITSANSTFSLSCPAVYPTAQPISGYAADDAFTFAKVKPAEAIMGVDAILSFGYTPYPVPLSFMLQANSLSNDVMDTIRQAMDAALEAFVLNATIALPATGKRYTFQNGTFTDSEPGPAAKRLLSAQGYELTFSKLIVSPIAQS